MESKENETDEMPQVALDTSEPTHYTSEPTATPSTKEYDDPKEIQKRWLRVSQEIATDIVENIVIREAANHFLNKWSQSTTKNRKANLLRTGSMTNLSHR